MRIFFASAHAAFCLGGAWFTECHSLPRRRTWQHGAQALLPAAPEEWETTLTQVLVEKAGLALKPKWQRKAVIPFPRLEGAGRRAPDSESSPGPTARDSPGPKGEVYDVPGSLSGNI